MTLNPTTLIFETVNFLILVWLLGKVLYKPLRRAIETREKALADQQAEADGALARAKDLEAQWSSKNQQLLELGEQVRSEALRDAIAEKGRMLTQAREDAAAERAKAAKLLEAERRDAENWVRTTAIEESTALAGRLLLSLAPESLDEALATALCEEVGKRAQQLTTAAANGGAPEAEVTGARIPPDHVVQRLRAILSEALGREPRLSLHEDPELLAGLTLRVGDQVLDASVAGQLEVFQRRAQELLEQAHG